MIWGLVIFYFLMFCALLIESNMHGKLKEGKHNFWTTLIGVVFWTTLIGVVIELFFVWWMLGWIFW